MAHVEPEQVTRQLHGPGGAVGDHPLRIYAGHDASTGRVRHLKRLWLETDVLRDRPPHFANRSHWEQRRSISRLDRGFDKPTPRDGTR